VDGTAASKLGHDVHHGHEGQLHPAEGLGLMEAEEARLVQELLVVAQEHARVLALLGALAQRRHQSPRAPHRLVVVDAGEIAPGRLGQRSHVVVRPPSPWPCPSPRSESHVRGGL
jgi:hypothetical protein